MNSPAAFIARRLEPELGSLRLERSGPVASPWRPELREAPPSVLWLGLSLEVEMT